MFLNFFKKFCFFLMSALFGLTLCVEGFSANKFHVEKQSRPWQGKQRWMTRAHLLSTLGALISPTTSMFSVGLSPPSRRVCLGAVSFRATSAPPSAKVAMSSEKGSQTATVPPELPRWTCPRGRQSRQGHQHSLGTPRVQQVLQDYRLGYGFR